MKLEAWDKGKFEGWQTRRGGDPAQRGGRAFLERGQLESLCFLNGNSSGHPAPPVQKCSMLTVCILETLALSLCAGLPP